MSNNKGQPKVLKGSRLIDGNGGEPIKNAVVLIEGERIKEVGSESQVRVPAGAEVLDMGACTLMPGLIDCHVHLFAPNVLTFRNHRAAQLEVTPQLQMLYTLLHAQIDFEMGFTTLRDVWWLTSHGENNTDEMIAIRDAINAGIFAGPRLLVSGLAVISNSHLQFIVPANLKLQPDTVADGPWELRKVARRQLRAGCDLIKTCASGGGATHGEEPTIRNITQEELDAIVDEAHAFGKHCACHCFTPEAQRMAVKAGVDTLEHCVFTDDEAIQMIKEANKPIVPTLIHRTDHAIEIRRQMGSTEFVTNKMKRIQPYPRESFKRLLKAGIKIAMGTDTGIDCEAGGMAGELEIYVDCGMTPMEAIQTATKNAAEAIWLGKDTGTLDVGKFADVIAVDGNPLEDIRVLQERNKIKMVMKEGRAYVDKRKGHEKYVIHDQDYGWKIWT